MPGQEIKSDAVADIASAMVELKMQAQMPIVWSFLDSAFANSSGKLNMSETLSRTDSAISGVFEVEIEGQI